LNDLLTRICEEIAMLHRLVSWLLLLGGILALGLGAYSYFTDYPAGPYLIAHERTINLTDCPVGEVRPLAIRLRNDSGRSVRIVGVEEC
jgi:hypothetical protein